MESWLETRWMGRFMSVLVDNGWDTLDKLKNCNNEEQSQIMGLFPKSGHRLKMRLLLDDLKDIDTSNNNDDDGGGGVSKEGDVKVLPPSKPVEVAKRVSIIDVILPPPPPDDDDNVDIEVLERSSMRSSMSMPSRNAPSAPTPALKRDESAEDPDLPPPPPPLDDDDDDGEPVAPPKKIVVAPRVVNKPPVPPVPVGAPPIANDASTNNENESDVDSVAQSVSSDDDDNERHPRQANGELVEAENSNNNENANVEEPQKQQGDEVQQRGESHSFSTNLQSLDLPAPPQPPSESDGGEGHTGGDDQNTSNVAEYPPVPDNDDDLSDSSSDGVPNGSAEPSAIGKRVNEWEIATVMKQPPPLPVGATERKRMDTDLRKRKEQIEEKIAVPKGDHRPLQKSVKIEASDEFRSKLAAMGKNLKLGGPPPKVLSKQKVYHQQSEDFDNEDHPGLAQLPNTEQLQDNQQHSGYLDKRGTGMFNKAYKTRWCILRECVLYWLRAQDDPKPLGMLNVLEKGVTVRYPVGDDTHMMEVVTQKKAYVFRAESEDEMKEWVEALRVAQDGLPAAKVPVTAVVSDPFQASSDDLNPSEVDRLKDLLKIGSMFIKYKHKKGKDRMIWCPIQLDRVYWGDQSKKKIKGHLMISDIQRLSDGCFGAKRVEHAFTIITNQRTLELEACSKKEKDDWVRALQYMVDHPPQAS